MNPIKKMEGLAAVILWKTFIIILDCSCNLWELKLWFMIQPLRLRSVKWNCFVGYSTWTSQIIPRNRSLSNIWNGSDWDRTEWQVTCSAFIAIILILLVRKSIGFNICLVTYHYSFIYLFATGSIAPPFTYKNNRCNSRLVEKMDNLERLANKAKQSVCLYVRFFWKKKQLQAAR